MRSRAIQYQMLCASLLKILLKKVKIKFCQKWIFLLYTKTSKFYPICLDYYANLPRISHNLSKPLIELNYAATHCTMQSCHGWNFRLDNFHISIS